MAILRPVAAGPASSSATASTIAGSIWSGRDGDPEPGGNRSLAYWHGWRNGAVDFKHRKMDPEQMHIARLWLARQRKERAA